MQAGAAATLTDLGFVAVSINLAKIVATSNPGRLRDAATQDFNPDARRATELGQARAQFDAAQKAMQGIGETSARRWMR
jgi:hypothetical protein